MVLKRGQLLPLIMMDLLIQENGRAKISMGLVYKNGLMEPGMKVITKIIRLTAKEHLIMLMVTDIRESGKEIKLMDMAITLIQMERHTKDTGKMMYSTD
jgi:hypothetical protein